MYKDGRFVPVHVIKFYGGEGIAPLIVDIGT